MIDFTAAINGALREIDHGSTERGIDILHMALRGVEKDKPRVIVTIRGGVFENFYSSEPVNFSILDYDNMNACEGWANDPDGAERYHQLEEETKALKPLDEDDE